MSTPGKEVETNGRKLPTRKFLVKIPSANCLYRHKVNDTYYAITKHGGKQRTHSLDARDRKVADRHSKDWLDPLDKLDVEMEKTTLRNLQGQLAMLKE